MNNLCDNKGSYVLPGYVKKHSEEDIFEKRNRVSSYGSQMFPLHFICEHLKAHNASFSVCGEFIYLYLCAF